MTQDENTLFIIIDRIASFIYKKPVWFGDRLFHLQIIIFIIPTLPRTPHTTAKNVHS